ncbi:golgin subfamily A member 8B-like isoform X2 [Selaginella moellendorffii]|uniref:golgin subfamily A member 8B-like isoform X2 n=1 Tax=Selaginella moellendorffii TaxID=88036 RepID=UPI000D1D1140|nr:golgin subfamily A member 8B-like isoform X2 [Selaginella moellendorffii]|eukprot:XP_024538804.1 golgin subfamily A member 8B-like isoform X2 [Selaginella moellendorffii]
MLEDVLESSGGDEELDKAIGTLTSLLAEVNESLRENKEKVAPRVKLLQSLRKTKQDLEIVHAEKKRHHLEVSSLYERKLSRLQNEVESVQREFARENKLYQDKCAELEAVESSLEEVSKEQQGSLISLGLRNELQRQEELKFTLEQRQQRLKDVEQYNNLQMAMMKDLVTLLSAKLKQYSSAARPAIYSSVTALETEADDRSQL